MVVIVILPLVTLADLILLWIFVTDSQKPLVGQLQDAESTVSMPASCPSPAIVDVFENARSKLYAIFSKMGKSSCICDSLHSR